MAWSRVAGIVAVLGLLVSAGPAPAQDDSIIQAFAGSWEGGGVARNDLDDYFNITPRDLNVTITPRGAGFKLDWTTVYGKGGQSTRPKVSRKSASLTFVPSGRPQIYRTDKFRDPIDGTPYAWARIRGQTLTVHWLVITEPGSYEMQTYDRTLTGSGLMDLRFTRVRDGGGVKFVTGKLIRIR